MAVPDVFSAVELGPVRLRNRVVTAARPDWPQPATGDGCYRVEVVGEPMMTLDLTHRGEHGDHNVSGMITTAMRLVNAVEAVVAAHPGSSPPSTCRSSPPAAS